MTDLRTREGKERLALLYKEILDSDQFIEEVGSLKHFQRKDLAPEFAITIEKLNELYSSSKGCKWDSDMILIDLESFECKNTKTYFRLESDINIMNEVRDDISQIFKVKIFKTDEKHNRLKNIQKEKIKMKDYLFIQSLHQRINSLPKIALFEELDKYRPKIEEQVDYKKKIDGKISDFWKKYPKQSFLDNSIKLNATEKASNFFREIMAVYCKTVFKCDEIDSQLGLIENLLKATVLRVGKKKASYVVFERIYEVLLSYSRLDESPMMQNMRKKKEICENLKDIETKLKVNEQVSYQEVKERFSQFKSICEEIELKGTEEYVGSIIKKIDPILSRLKPAISQEELSKILSHLIDLPYKLDEQVDLEEKLQRVHAFNEKCQQLSVVHHPDRLVAEYRSLEVKIASFENIVKKMESDKQLLAAVVGETQGKVDWQRGIKLLNRLKHVTMSDTKQAQLLILNNSLSYLTSRFIWFLKKRNLCPLIEGDEIILETCHTIQRAKRLEFLKKEKIRGEDISCLLKVAEQILENEMDLYWVSEDWMRDKEFELNDLRDGQRFLKNLSKDLDLNSEADPSIQELPRGAYLEDFVNGYQASAPEDTTSADLIRGLLQDIQKNLERNAIFELGKISAFLETERLFCQVREKHTSPRRFEMYLQRLSHFLWKIRAHKLDTISGIIKSFNLKFDVMIRLASKSETTLKKLEAKLKTTKKLRRLFNRSSRFYCRPDKLLSKEAKQKTVEEKDTSRKKSHFKDILDDWKGLKAHFKVELEPGLDKSREFDLLFNKLRCKDIGKPPMNIVFSRQLTTREFADKLVASHQSRGKEMEIGAFHSARLRGMRKFMLRRGCIYQANLDNCVLYLFCKEHWPSNNPSLNYYEQQMKSSDELYCLLIFVPDPTARRQSVSANKKRDSSSIFDLEDEELDNPKPVKQLKKPPARDKQDSLESEDRQASDLGGKHLAPNPPIAQHRLESRLLIKPVAQEEKIWGVVIEEVKEDFDEFLTDYENNPFSQEDADFLEFAKLFDILNPDFIYEIGQFDDQQNDPNSNAFCGNLDQIMTEELLPQNGDLSCTSYYQDPNIAHFENFDADDSYQPTFGNHYGDDMAYSFNAPPYQKDRDYQPKQAINYDE